MFLKALFAMEMNPDERVLYGHHTGRGALPCPTPSESAFGRGSKDCLCDGGSRALAARLALVAQLQSLLRDLALERKARELPDLHQYLADKGAHRSAGPPVGHTSTSDGASQETRAQRVQGASS